MRLEWVIPCTEVHFPAGEEPITIHGAGFDHINVPALPQRIDFTVLLRVAGLPFDFTEDAPRTIEVYLTGPGLDHLAALDMEVPPGEPGPDHVEGWEVWTFVPVAIGFTAQQAGPHMLDIYLATDRPERLVDPSRRRSLHFMVALAN